MKTTFEVSDLIYGIVNVPAVTSVITGKVYKDQRPADSKKEDVVINCLPISVDQFQQATVNVNVYVNDLDVKIDGVPQRMPNHSRLKQLSVIATGLLAKYFGTEQIFKITSQSLIKENTLSQHYINIRIEYKNTNF